MAAEVARQSEAKNNGSSSTSYSKVVTGQKTDFEIDSKEPVVVQNVGLTSAKQEAKLTEDQTTNNMETSSKVAWSQRRTSSPKKSGSKNFSVDKFPIFWCFNFYLCF